MNDRSIPQINSAGFIDLKFFHHPPDDGGEVWVIFLFYFPVNNCILFHYILK